MEAQSVLDVPSPDFTVKFSPKQDSVMREIVEKYRQIMNAGESSKENLFLKKLRF